MNEIYDCNYSEFDLEMHKQTYIDYLEVIIHPDGYVEYAHPSHILKLEEIYYKTHSEKVSYDDYSLSYFCEKTGCIAVWYNGYLGDANEIQYNIMNKFCEEGVMKHDSLIPYYD